MKRPAKPKATKQSLKRCDGSVVRWTQRWVWSGDTCDECGHKLNTGHWYDAAIKTERHVGDIEPKATLQTYGRGGKWTCCGEKVPSFAEMMEAPSPFYQMVNANAVLTGLSDVDLT